MNNLNKDFKEVSYGSDDKALKNNENHIIIIIYNYISDSEIND